MTLKESLFNKGIYINTLLRFKWGSLLYFIVLFLAAPFVFLTSTQNNLLDTRLYDAPESLLLRDISLGLPVVTALFVPTVVTLMVFKFVHSQKQGIFVHSLPVSRSANYISALLAAFTLMALPVILTGIILIVMSLVAYDIVIGVVPALIWTGINLSVLFIMFAVAVFAALLTGNSFAMIAINGIIYVIPAVSALLIDSLGRKFFYGYVASHVLDKMIEFSPPVWICSKLFSEDPDKFLANPGTWIYIAAAVIVYICAYFLYRKRRIELCGDVAGFNIMKPILKYTVSAIAAILCFASIGFMEIGIIARAFVTAVICGVVYFACEMVLRKSMRVFGTYKGFCVFSAMCAAVLCFSAFTNIFGFETYIPKAEDVVQAGIYCQYYENVMPSVTDIDGIKSVIKHHSSVLENIPVTENEFMENSSSLHIEYKLKNGRTVKRNYNLESELCDNALSEMFAYNEYKQNFFGLSALNIENITVANLQARYGDSYFEQFVNSDADKLFNALNSDVEALTYENYTKNYPLTFSIQKNLTEEDNDKHQVFKTVQHHERYYDYHFNVTITPEFKNTIAFLNEKGYYNSAREVFTNQLYITDRPFETKDGSVYPDPSEKIFIEHRIPKENIVKLDAADAQLLFDETAQRGYDHNVSDGEWYYVFCENQNSSEFYIGSHCLKFTPEELPEYLKKYVN